MTNREIVMAGAGDRVHGDAGEQQRDDLGLATGAADLWNGEDRDEAADERPERGGPDAEGDEPEAQAGGGAGAAPDDTPTTAASARLPKIACMSTPAAARAAPTATRARCAGGRSRGTACAVEVDGAHELRDPDALQKHADDLGGRERPADARARTRRLRSRERKRDNHGDEASGAVAAGLGARLWLWLSLLLRAWLRLRRLCCWLRHVRGGGCRWQHERERGCLGRGIGGHSSALGCGIRSTSSSTGTSTSRARHRVQCLRERPHDLRSGGQLNTSSSAMSITRLFLPQVSAPARESVREPSTPPTMRARRSS